MQEVLIQSIVKTKKPTQVYMIDTEPFDVFIANGLVTHNKSFQPDSPCDGGEPDVVVTCLECSWTNGDVTAQTEVEADIGSGFVYYTTVDPGVNFARIACDVDLISNSGKCRVRHTKGGFQSGYSTASSYVSADQIGPYEVGFGCCRYGCMIAGTQILMADGSLKNVENVIAGDVVQSIDVEGLDTNEQAGLLFESAVLSYKPSQTSVVSTRDITAENIYNINGGLLVTSDTHVHFIKREGIWQFELADQLVVGDILLQF